ncbi:lysophospholipid acyltransferase 5 [Aplysia californica]|uniref:Lysophospholipid acyltransferase 5 n=1 Tax=Aplysia californica TaxID=6500 RepID=A0ABM0K5G7_APLCA|nr:lysophospholipid acyltransferase 5 [Aplysia californica]
MVAASLASLLGSSEGAIKLLLSLFLGYPLAFLYRSPLVYRLPPALKHVFFVAVGFSICYYNFGADSAHLVANVTVIYLMLLLCGGTKFSVIFALVFNTSYLILAYYFQMSTYEFGISWSMPLCVVTLRLTGVVFDYYDGQKKEIPADAKESALVERPGYLEMLGHVFFFGGVMVGPQFTLKRYLSFVNGEFSDKRTGGPPNSVSAGLQRLILGVAYIFVFQIIALYLPDSYLESPEFFQLGFLSKCALILLWGKNALHKYVGVWLVTEGSIILTGMSYNGVNELGVEQWDACKNIRVWHLESGESFADFIRSFNVNTNQWMSRYIFKRLRFLGSKTLSQLVTLFYLALWHGLQSGYYMCFFLELLQTNAETQWQSVFKRCQAAGYLPEGGPLSWVGRVVRKLVLVFLWSYALLGFVLHEYNRWLPIYHSVYHAGFVVPALVMVLAPVLRSLIPAQSQTNGVHVEKAKVKKEL